MRSCIAAWRCCSCTIWGLTLTDFTQAHFLDQHGNTRRCALRVLFADGSQRGQAVAPLQQPADGQVPLVLLLQAGVLRAQVGHLLLQLPYPSPLPLQQLLLGLDDLVELRQIFRSPCGVLGRALHVGVFGFLVVSQMVPRSPGSVQRVSPLSLCHYLKSTCVWSYRKAHSRV